MSGRQERRKTKTRDRGGRKTIRSGGEYVAGSTSPLTKGKRRREILNSQISPKYASVIA